MNIFSDYALQATMPSFFVPSAAYCIALVASVSLPIWLVVVSWVSPRYVAPARRLIIAILVAPLAALVLGVGSFPELFMDRPLPFADLICSSLLYLTSIMITYSMWSLIGYGFTVSILTDACHARQPHQLDKVIAAFAGGRGLSGFALDRTGVLLRMRLMSREGNQFRISGPKALRFARTVKFAMDIYAVRRRESK